MRRLKPWVECVGNDSPRFTSRLSFPTSDFFYSLPHIYISSTPHPNLLGKVPNFDPAIEATLDSILEDFSTRCPRFAPPGVGHFRVYQVPLDWPRRRDSVVAADLSTRDHQCFVGRPLGEARRVEVRALAGVRLDDGRTRATGSSAAVQSGPFHSRGALSRPTSTKQPMPGRDHEAGAVTADQGVDERRTASVGTRTERADGSEAI